MKIVESILKSKTGSDSGGEDAIVLTDNFVAVIDGATSQSDRKLNGLTGGQFAAREISEAIKRLPLDIDAASAIHALTDSIHQACLAQGILDEMERAPHERATASVAIYSRHRRQVWFVGDCQGLFLNADGTEHHFLNEKRIDEVNAAARALYLSTELARGVSVDALRERDAGRHFITPLLKRQRMFQNSAIDCEYSYWVIDGFPVNEQKGIRVESVSPNVRGIVLATDGYPKLFRTLHESEQFLKSLVNKDPLLIGEFKSTKGVQAGQESFDDRAYVRLDVTVPA